MNEITARGVLVVVSVGNEGGAVASPANCAGVLGVAGIRHAGTKVGFSNLGPGTGIGAPGGNCVNPQPFTALNPCLFPITAAVNSGTTTPVASTYTDHVDRPNFGTSFSAPLVAGAAALMHSLNSQLSSAQYITLLSETASPFPTSSATTTNVCHVPAGDLQPEECICTTETCGAGMLNTHAAVLAAQRPFAIADASSTITAGIAAGIDASSSFASNGRTITSYQWTRNRRDGGDAGFRQRFATGHDGASVRREHVHAAIDGDGRSGSAGYGGHRGSNATAATTSSAASAASSPASAFGWWWRWRQLGMR